MVRPADGEILEAFSDGELVKSKTLSVWKTHDGIDIAAAQGENVKSICAGTVSEVTDDPMMGITVVIDHGSGYTGYYCNLAEEVKISAGDEVSAGTVIGEVMPNLRTSLIFISASRKTAHGPILQNFSRAKEAENNIPPFCHAHLCT